MNKTKTFSLFSFTEEGRSGKIQCVVKRGGSFNSTARIMFRSRENRLTQRNRYRDKKRGLGYKPISFYHSGCQMHHINQNEVIACPEYIHENIPHCLEDGSALKLEGVLG